MSYDAATYRPQTPELRYFLTRFVALHFSRLRATIQRDYPDSLFFLDPGLADATIAQNEQSRVMETYLTNPSADEVDIDVKNVTFGELSKSPYKASVDFEKRYVAPGTRQERKRETFVAQIDFVLRDAVPNTFIRVNPLGLQITYFRVDQAFRLTAICATKPTPPRRPRADTRQSQATHGGPRPSAHARLRKTCASASSTRRRISSRGRPSRASSGPRSRSEDGSHAFSTSGARCTTRPGACSGFPSGPRACWVRLG